MKALSLFSGIGGLDLAAEMAGIEVVGLCEIEPFPVEVLKKRFPGVYIFEDVRKLTAEVIRDRTGMDASQTIDVIFGGFPCQDLSVAGKQRGLEGERSGLWFEMLRVISELRPRYVVAENVRGAVNLALDTVYTNLVGEGYKVYPYVIPAAAFGAPHQRERLFVIGIREDVANAYSKRYLYRESQLNTTEAGKYAQRDTATGDTFMENPGCELQQGTEFSGADGVETGNRDADKSERSGGTLWPTPRANKIGGSTSPGYGLCLEEATKGGRMWPTPVKEDYRRRGPNSKQQGLPEVIYKLWPTPAARDYKDSSGQKNIDNPRPNEGYILPLEVYRQERKLWPTPREFMYKDSVTDRNKGNIGEKVGGQLSPDWVEQLMNFPEGWTDLEVDEPKPWAGWPALLGERLWGTHTSTGACRSNRFLGNADRAMSPVEFVSKGEESSQYPYEFPRTTTGCKNRAKRLKALGNAVVPAQAYPFFRAIVEIERAIKEDNNEG